MTPDLEQRLPTARPLGPSHPPPHSTGSNASNGDEPETAPSLTADHEDVCHCSPSDADVGHCSVSSDEHADTMASETGKVAALPRETNNLAEQRRKPGDSQIPHRRLSLRSPLFFAFLTAGAFAALWPISYSNTCTFQVSPRSDVDLPQVRAALLDFLWANANPELGEWNVSSTQDHSPLPLSLGRRSTAAEEQRGEGLPPLPLGRRVAVAREGRGEGLPPLPLGRRVAVAREGRGEGFQLKFTLLTSGSPKTQTAEQLARDFLRHFHSLVSQQTAPTESETYLTRLYADAQKNLQDASNAMEAAPPSQSTDPLAKRNESIGERSHLAASYAAAAAAWTQAQQRLDNLTQSGPPTTGVVPKDMLRSGHQADHALQQDLRELNVRLTELRAELIAATQQATENLSPLADTATALIERLRNREESSDVSIAAATSGLETSAANYLNRLHAFSREFASAARTIESTTVDPLHDDVINAYVKFQKLAGDFLFDASRLLTAMRTQIDALSEGEAAAPRNYQFTSDLARAFGQLQTTHHRFEFAAAKIDSANNFRLDSALRSSRGLRSRTRERLASIEKTLQAEALEHARAQYARDLLDAQAAYKTTRAEFDAAIADLLQADESVLASIAPSDEFLQSAVRRELAEATAANHRAQIAQMQDLLDRLAARRHSLTAEPIVTLAALETTLAPHDLPRRLTISTLAAAIAFLSLLVGQFLSVPRHDTPEGRAAAR